MQIVNLDFITTTPTLSDSDHPATVKGGLTVQSIGLAIAQGSQLAITLAVTQTWALKFPL